MCVMGLSGKVGCHVSPSGFAPLWALLALCAGLLVSPARAPAYEPPKGITQVLSGSEVRLEVDHFGVGDTARRGEWCGVRLLLTDSGSKPREVLVRLAGTDADGDHPVQQREVTLNPGVAQSVWMYLRLPFNYVAGEGLIASVYEALDGGIAPDGGRGYRAGALLARGTLDPKSNSVQHPAQGLIGVVGERSLGLAPYNGLSLSTGGPNDVFHPYTHENSFFAVGLTGAEMPDRWMGLTQFDVIVWGKGEPGELRGDKANAMREWITRGGHLVVVLPAVGQNWTNEKVNELFDVMPQVAVARVENANLSDFRPLLIGTRRPQFPARGTIHTFRVLDGIDPGVTTPILDAPDGKCVVVRRTVGAGAVTFIGIDLNATAFSQFDAVDADIFWHRVLGRRGWLIRPAQTGPGRPAGFTSRSVWALDKGVGELINQSGRTALGLLAGLVVFVLYWAIAGPAGYFLLKAKGWQRHAWVSFLGASGVFTAVAWGGATLLRPQRVDVRHVTVLDHVYGQARERARMFASVLIPSYGEARIGVTEDGGSVTVSPWEAPVDQPGWTGFPDARSYLIDTRSPSSLNVPTRATVKQVQVDWSGGPPWGMPLPQGPDGAPGRLTLDPNGGGASGNPLVNGVLVHKLPGTLKQVKVIVVRGQTTLKPVRGKRGDTENLPLVRGEAYDYSEWAPQTPLDLGTLTSPITKSEARQLLPWLNSLTPGSVGNGLTEESGEYARGFDDRLRAMTFMGYLKPADSGENAPAPPAAQRWCLHGYDLNRWLTQPCVIVLGFLDSGQGDGPSPVPLTVDGKLVPTSGRTLVRWVYPLPGEAPAYPSEAEIKPGAADETSPEPKDQALPEGAGQPQ